MYPRRPGEPAGRTPSSGLPPRRPRLTGLVFVALAALTACDAVDEVTRPADVEPGHPVGPANIIIENGEDHFFFLPPIDRPDSNGEFNPYLATDVEICEWDRSAAGDGDPATDPCLSVLESFETAEIYVDQGDGSYQVNWKIRDTAGIEAGTLYGIRVLASGVALGSAEVVIGRNANRARQLARGYGDGVIPLNANQTLPISYRVEYGIFCEGECVEMAIGQNGGTVTNPSRDVGATFPPGALPEGVEDVTVIIEEIELGPEDECFGELGVLPTSGRCIRFDTEPGLESGFAQDVVVGICTDYSEVPAGLDPGNFLIHRFDPDNPSQGVEELPGAAAPFLDCSAFGIAQLDRGPFSRFAHAGMNALRRILGPAPLSARDEGFGGVTSRFSHFQWALPIEIVAVSSTSQTGIAGQRVDEDPTVQVLTAHYHADAPQVPVPGQLVSFTFFDVGAGSGSSIAARHHGHGPPGSGTAAYSDANGYASVPWTLTNNLGIQSVEASAFNTATVVFTALACSPDDGCVTIDGASNDP